jgi:ribosomal protein L28
MKKFELRESPVKKGEFVIHNHLTGEAASQSLKSLAIIRRRFKANLCSTTKFFFSNLQTHHADAIRRMLPNHQIS